MRCSQNAPDEETPVQTRNREFWQYQFMYWQAWRAGDVEAIAHAVTCCMSYNRRPPLWLCRAGYELREQCRAGDEKRELNALREHFRAGRRWSWCVDGAQGTHATTKGRCVVTLFGRRRRSSWQAPVPRPAPRRCARATHWSGAPAARRSLCRATGVRWKHASGDAEKKFKVGCC